MNASKIASVRIDHHVGRDDIPPYEVVPIHDDGFGRTIHDEARRTKHETLNDAEGEAATLLHPEEDDDAG